ncbi:MAG: DUF4401 domain-containing protein, partial [Sphingobacteriales bacterium]
METGSTTGKKTLAIVCTPRGFGGLEMNTLKQARTLEEKGWTVWLLVNELSPMYTEAAKYCSNITSVQQVSGGGEKPKARWIHKWLKEKNPAILFTPYNKDIKSLSVYKRFYNRKVKLVYQQHMKVGVKKRDLIHRLRYNMLDLWISPLPYLKEETIEKTTVPAEKIAVVPLGLEHEKRVWIPAACALGLLTVMTLNTPGVLVAALMLTLGFHRRSRVMLGLAVAFLLTFGSFYYYDLRLT